MGCHCAGADRQFIHPSLPPPPFPCPSLHQVHFLRTQSSTDEWQVVYWVETKGKTLEEIDAIFEGEKHSSVPDVEEVRHGEKTVTVEAVDKQVYADKMN